MRLFGQPLCLALVPSDKRANRQVAKVARRDFHRMAFLAPARQLRPAIEEASGHRFFNVSRPSMAASCAERNRLARWPREIALPGLPRTRTCRFPASGSSTDGFALHAACRPFAIRSTFVERAQEHGAALFAVDRMVPSADSAFPPQGRLGGYPYFAGTTRCYDFSSLVLLCLSLPLAPRYRLRKKNLSRK
jgi:hypothetical protein